MTTGSDPEQLDVPKESVTELPDTPPSIKPDLGETELPRFNTVRRKRRRRNFVSSSAESSRTHLSPSYVAPPPDLASARRRRRSRRRSNRRKYARAMKFAMYIAIQVVFITLLVFLWMKISAKVNE